MHFDGPSNRKHLFYAHKYAGHTEREMERNKRC